MNTETALQPTPRPGGLETSSSASAALAKATIEAKFVIAMNRPRSVMNARASILDACKRPAFATSAWYRKPVGKGVEGFSIRFAEQALSAWRNVDVTAVTAWETDDQRLVRITVTDLESNLSYADEVLLNKTVERHSVKDGQEVVGKRQNSNGDTVYIVRATEDDLLNKVNAAKSKAIRNSGLRLIPQDILEEAEEVLKQTRAAADKATDPQAALKKLADAFNGLGVSPSELEAYLGHALAATQPAEIATLRGIYTALKEGEARWSDYVKAKAPVVDAEVVPQNVTREAMPSSATPPKSPQETLADLVTGWGYTFDDWRKWAVDSGNASNADSLASFDDVPASLCKRLLKAADGMRQQIAAMKGLA